MTDDMAVYIANLGRYNEGYLVGAWFTFPIDEEDVKEKIGLNEQYEEYVCEIASHGNCTPRPFQKKASDPRSDPRATVGKVVLPRPILTE